MSPTGSSTSTPPTSSANPATNGSTSTSASAMTDPLASESTFLTLLVSQLQNQDPLDPVDSTQFVSQLTSYAQLEQLIDIHQNTGTLVTDASATSTTSTSGT